ncbi:Epsin-3, clathrin recruitment and traffic between the Golgi and endosome [Rhizina undulata]
MNLDNLRDTIQNISLYDVKAAVRKAQNVVMNYTEMEAKVREATNNEPWGASSTLMQEIASGTYSYQLLNEIMPMIYKRFTEKSAEEWRQIYKALQLLEFLIKNGSEQVIDDARSHLSTIKMLRQFHFIDLNGKDQGINVRNRAKELAELLSDVDRIRAERKKARATKNKYGGVEGGHSTVGYGVGSGGSEGRRFGGFGSESLEFGGYSGGVYGDGGGFGGSSRPGGFHDESSSQRFEEYDEYDEGVGAAPSKRSSNTASASGRRSQPVVVKQQPSKKEQDVDLFSFGDDEPPNSTAAAMGNSNTKQKARALDDFGALQSGGAEDDDFGEFQSESGSAAPSTATQPNSKASILATFSSLPGQTATASNTSLMHPKPMSASTAVGINDLVGISSMSSSPAPSKVASPTTLTPATTGGGMSSFGGMGGMASMKPMAPSGGYQPTQPNYYTSVPVASTTSNIISPISPTGSAGTVAASTQKKSGDAFGSLWNSASAGLKKPSTPVASNQPTLQAMAKEKASAGIWGTAKPQGSAAHGGSGSASNDLDDLLG